MTRGVINTDKEKLLNHDFLTTILDYDYTTGLFKWKVFRGGSAIKGSSAGTLNKSNGYINLKINSINYRAHRVAWFFQYKKWPIGLLDHIDGNKSNNAISNLREATYSQNKCNTSIRSDNTTGYRGITFRKDISKWRAIITIKGITENIGSFTTIEEAIIAYETRAKVLFGEFYNERN